MLGGIGDSFRDIALQLQASMQHYNEAMAMGVANVFSSNFLQLILSAAIGSAFTYVVLLTRIDERQAVFKETLVEYRVTLEKLKSKVDANTTMNASQEATINLRLQQCTENYITLRDMFNRIEQRFRRHEEEDRDQFRHQNGGRPYGDSAKTYPKESYRQPLH